MIIREIQFYITQIYNSIDVPYNKDYQHIKEALYDKDVSANEEFNWKKKEIDVQLVKVRNSLNDLSTCTEELETMTKQCLAVIEKEKEKYKKIREHARKYNNN
jgi:dihydroxyacid dehydratase/phosphogluconate dehydratase